MRNVHQAIANARSQFRINEAIGIEVNGSAEDNWAAMNRVWDESPENEEFRRRVARAVSRQRSLFRHHGSELGHHYPPGRAVIDDGTPLPDLVDDILIAPMVARPGYHLPHAWVQDLGRPVALLDLVPTGGFLLVCGTAGERWVQAAATLSSQLEVDLKAIRVGIYDGDWVDIRAQWARTSGITDTGAVLVRPDG